MYASKDLKGLADSENPLNPVNRIHNLFKMFLNAHSGFNRDELQGYLNLYSFVINPPADHLEKVEKINTISFINQLLCFSFHCARSSLLTSSNRWVFFLRISMTSTNTP